MTKKISELDAGAAVAGGNELEANQGGSSKRVTAAQVRDYVEANPTATRPINKGGTGATTAQAARNNLLPAQAGNATKFLQTDGTDATWQTATAGVTAVDSPNSTMTVSIAGTTLHADINLAHANTWTAEQAFAATVAGVAVAAKMLPAGLGYAAHFEAGGAAPTTANICTDGTCASFGNGGMGVAICSGTTALVVAGGLFDCTGPAEFSGQVGFFGTTAVSLQAANQALTDSTGGFASTTLNACGDTSTSDQSGTINANFATVAARLAELRSLLLAYGLGS